MAKELLLVVGQDPHSYLIGFDTTQTYDYGVCVPDKRSDKLVAKVTANTDTDAIAMTCAGLIGTKYMLTTEAGVRVALTGSAGAMTGSSADFTTSVGNHLNGVLNLMLNVIAVAASAGTSSAKTIVVVLNEAADVTDVSHWSVDIDSGTPNVVTGVTFDGLTAIVTVTDDILTGEVVTITHTTDSGDEVDAISALAVTNNET